MLLRLALAIGYLLPALLPAQASMIRGRVVDGSRSEPLDGAVVELQDAGGKRIGRVVTSPSGLFLLTAPAAGRYQVRALAIGYAGGLARAVEVPTSGVSLGDLTLMPAVRLLPDVHLVGNRKLCGAEVGKDPFVAKLLEAAKTSFEVADATIASGRRFTVELVSVRQVTTGRRVATRTDTTRESLARWPVESVEPDSLRIRGFVRPLAPIEARQGLTYHGPDAEVLFSPWFLESHCFQSLVLTSPPYLNAIDFLRCSKFSLVWMGYDVAAVRKIRGVSIDAEAASEEATNSPGVRATIGRLRLSPTLSNRNRELLAR